MSISIPRLRVDGLRICRSGTTIDVASDVSFSVTAGEVLGLVGESGSGKTSVALALLGYARRGLVIADGTVALDGVDILTLSDREMRSIRGKSVAYVPQDPSTALNPSLRVGVQLREAYRAHAPDKHGAELRISELLDEVDLPATPEYLSRYPHQLSGGQQQRIALAIAFMWRPSLIVLDEPTTGLDVSTQRLVLETVTSLCRAHGVGAVFVSHDLAVVSGLATSVAVMYAGKVIEHGPTERVFGAPSHPYTRGLIEALPSADFAHELRGIEGQPPQPGGRPPGCSFAPRCSLRVARCNTEFPGEVVHDGRSVRCFMATELVASHSRISLHEAPQAVGTPILEVEAIRARYGSAEVLHGVSFVVPPHSCVALVGESGSGKTTLAGCIAGLHKEFQGELRFKGSPLSAGPAQRTDATRRAIQYVFQNPYASLNPRKTVGQLIAQPLEHHLDMSRADRETRVAQTLDDLSLSRSFVTRFPDQLSGGERQRVAIARALVVDPDLLICDEVTSALDVSAQAVIVELLRELQRKRDLSILFVTHNLALVRSIAQEVVVLARGVVVEHGTVHDVLEQPQEEYTMRLINDVPRFKGATP